MIRARTLDATSLDPGTYTVVWRVYSAEDDHTSSDSYTFSAGTGVAPIQSAQGGTRVSAAAVTGKWLELIGVVIVTGLAFFALTSSVERAGFTPPGKSIYGGLAALGLLGTVVSLRAREVAISGEPFIGLVDRNTLGELFASTYGRGWIARAVALSLMLAIALWRRNRQSEKVSIAVLFLGAVALVSIAATGHAGAADASFAAMTVDAVHLGGAAVWLGGLLGLLLVTPIASDWTTYRALLRQQRNRFLVAVIAIVAAGMTTVWWQIGGRRDLTQSTYGQTLLIKVAIVVAILGIAFYSRKVLQGERPRFELVPIAIGAELALALVVLLFSADLSLSPPANRPLPVTVAARAISLDATMAGDASVVELAGVLTGDPADRVTITVDPVTNMQRLIVKTQLTDQVSAVTVGDRFDADPVDGEPGTYTFPAGRIGVAGVWELDITVRRAGVQDEIVAFEVDTTALADRSTRLEDDRWGGIRPVGHTALALGLAVVMLLVGLGGLKRVTGLEPMASGFLLAASIVIASGFLVSGARSMVPVTPDHRVPNPVASDAATLTYAPELYRLNCAACHGVDGRGVGTTDIAHLHGNTADLTRAQTVNQSDGDLRYWIGNGIPGSDMPAFSPALTSEEQWLLVRYIRELQDAARAADGSGE